MTLRDLEPTRFVDRHVGPDAAEQAAMLADARPRVARRAGPGDRAARHPRRRAARPARGRRRDGGPRGAARPRRPEHGARLAARHRLLEHRHAARHPAQRAREPGLVHRVHAVPARDLPGSPRGALELPDHGRRPDRHGPRQRVAARRVDGRRGGDGALPPPQRRGGHHVRRRPRGAPPDGRGRAHPRRGARPRRRRRRPGDARPRRSACSACCSRSPAPAARSADRRDVIEALHDRGALVVVAADLLACTLLVPPGEQGADVVVGSTQRFGVPLGFGGPHAGYLAVARRAPAQPARPAGRRLGRRRRPARAASRPPDPRAAHPPRAGHQQHLHRPGAARPSSPASTPCTTGPTGSAGSPRGSTGWPPSSPPASPAGEWRSNPTRCASTRITAPVSTAAPTAIVAAARDRGASTCAASTPTRSGSRSTRPPPPRWSPRSGTRSGVAADIDALDATVDDTYPALLRRTSAFLTHPVFDRYHSETELLRYLRRLADRDLALDRTMIPLGSCTMKLNATIEMVPVTWPEFAQLHPFAPLEQAARLPDAVRRPRAWLCRDHRLRRGVAPAQRRLARRAGRAARHPRLPPRPRRRAPRRLPHPRVGARHQRGQRVDGRHAGRRGRLRRRRQRRRRPAEAPRRTSTPTGSPR